VDAIFIATSDGLFTDVNVSGERLLGYERGELIGKGVVNILHPEDINRFLVVRESMLEGNARLDEWTLVRKDGTFIEVEISANMLLDQCFQAFVRDITERKRMDELSERLARHAALRADVHAVLSSGEKSLQNVLQDTMESIVRHLDAAFARVWLLDEKREVLQLLASAGIYTRIDGDYSRFEVGRHKIGEIAAQKKSLFSNAILEFEQIDKEWAKREQLISFAGFPLIVNDKVTGVAAMFSRSAMPDDVLEAFESITAVIAQGVERKRAEEQLMLFKYTIDHVEDSAGIIAADARFLFVNDAFCKSLGYTREELLELTVHDIDPNFPKEIWAAHYDNLKAQKSLAAESIHRRKDGREFPVELSLNFLEYKGKEYSFAFGRDITERKRGEAELREKQQLLQAIFDNSTMLIYVKDLRGRALLVNRAFEEMLGLTGKDIIGKTEIELWQSSPTLQDNTQQIIEDYRDLDSEVFETGTPAQREESFIVAGEQRAFLTIKCPIYDDAGEPYAVCGISTDITERKRAEVELRANQQLLQAIFDNITALIHVKDLDGRLLIANRSFENALRLSKEQIFGKTLYELWELSPALSGDPNPSIDYYRAFDAEALAAGRSLQKELVSPLGGEERLSLATKCPLFEDEGEPYAVLTLQTDITEIKRAEKEMRRLQTELEHAGRAITMGALASSIAHEVNQPLAAIVTNGSACLRWLAMDPPDLEEARNALNRITRDGNRAAEVIARTRALLKKAPPQKSALDINEIARETIALAQYEIQKNRILLRTSFSDGLPPAAGDKIQLQQVLLNLLMNGIDALTKAGTGSERELSVETMKDKEKYILIAVKDSGVGLDADSIEKMFEAFYTTKEEGMGMGLSISRSIVEAHGGRLWASRNDKAGMTFQFTLPVGTDK
jgi:PAS domain S-box-containing protein